MKRVAIVGAGALGSHVAMLLRNAAELLVIDHDRLEQRNVEAQFHARGGVGKNKAVALVGLMQLVFTVRAIAIPTKLTSENASVVLHVSPALVIDCVDNAAGRRAAQEGARAHGVPCLHGGLAAAGAYGMVRWDDAFIIDDPPAGARTCEDGAHLPFVVEVATRIAMAAQAFLERGERRGYAIAPDGVTRV